MTSTRKAAQPEAELPPGRDPNLDIEQTIEGLPDQFIQCRDWQHSWRSHNAIWDADARCYEVTLRCSRCKSLRVRLIGRDGGLIRSNYEYREGYIIKGMGRITGRERDMLRLSSVLRLINNTSGDKS